MDIIEEERTAWAGWSGRAITASVADPVVTTTAESADQAPSSEVADASVPASEPGSTEPVADNGGTAAADESNAAGEMRTGAAFPLLDPPTGEPISIGLVNTEGVPGLDFPDIRLDIAAGVDYLNRHGGLGGRPIELETCVTAGSPETSQSCAQEVTGKGVDLVLLGLDLFAHYPTYSATETPVVGALPILPPDYTADAYFMTGGNATIMSAAAWVAKNHYGATTVGIVSADSPGSNASEAALVASLDLAGIEHTIVRGGNNETDAGYQGLVREAADEDPDLLISLYADAGCVGVMRGRAGLGLSTPVLATSACATGDVLDSVGDDAVGWSFIGVATPQETPESLILQEILAPVLDLEPAEVKISEVGLGGVALFMLMSLAVYANDMAAAGLEVTAANLYDYLGTEEGLELWPGAVEIACGASESNPSICSFTFPFGEYVEGGGIRTIPGLEEVSSLEYLG